MNPSESSRPKRGRRRPSAKSGESALSENLHRLEVEINHLRQLFRDTLQEYGITIESQITGLAESIREAVEENRRTMSPQQQKVLQEMVTVIRKLQVRPEKGRRKDLKRIEETIAHLTTLAEKWQWSK